MDEAFLSHQPPPTVTAQLGALSQLTKPRFKSLPEGQKYWEQFSLPVSESSTGMMPQAEKALLLDPAHQNSSADGIHGMRRIYSQIKVQTIPA